MSRFSQPLTSASTPGAPATPSPDFWRRPEVPTFIVALVVSALARLTPLLGPVPEAAVGQVVVIGWGVFVAAVIEGKYKGADYAGGFVQLFGSRKFRLLLLSIVGLLVNAGLAPFGANIPEETLVAIYNWVLGGVAAIGGLDALTARPR